MMRTLYSAILFALLLSFSAYAQEVPPEAFNYSAVARDADGNPLMNTSLGIQTTIRQSAADGVIVYQENHTVETDEYGLLNLAVGTGDPQQGEMASIAWGADDYYLEVSMDIDGGTDFAFMGATQLLSVPYALYAKSAGSLESEEELYIGMEYQGGIIFHLFKDEGGNQHGLIVSLQDLGIGQVPWGFIGIDVSGTESYWEGGANTMDLQSAGYTGTEAVGLCINYEVGEYDDWYLPSIYELKLMWDNFYDLSRVLSNHPNATEIARNGYWSSTEINADQVWRFLFEDGGIYNDSKDDVYRVRAVRAF